MACCAGRAGAGEVVVVEDEVGGEVAFLAAEPSPKTDMKVGNEARSDCEPDVTGIVCSSFFHSLLEDVTGLRRGAIVDSLRLTAQR